PPGAHPPPRQRRASPAGRREAAAACRSAGQAGDLVTGSRPRGGGAKAVGGAWKGGLKKAARISLRRKTDPEQDALRLHIVGLEKEWDRPQGRLGVNFLQQKRSDP